MMTNNTELPPIPVVFFSFPPLKYKRRPLEHEELIVNDSHRSSEGARNTKDQKSGDKTVFFSPTCYPKGV